MAIAYDLDLRVLANGRERLKGFLTAVFHNHGNNYRKRDGNKNTNDLKEVCIAVGNQAKDINS